ncbi:MAG TPA: ABC transporter ATP-binding protein [Bacteroidales bacterium]|nr:ABC transporter ATP-binding protein [Bacteroidales bacterium]
MNISVKKLDKSYRQSIGGAVRTVLSGLDLEVAAGDTVAIMGPSGSGKTTLLNLIGTLDNPDSGSIQLGDTFVSGMSEKEILSFRNQQAGFVFQFHNLLPQCTLLENILLPTLPFKGDKTALHHRAEELMTWLGVKDLQNNKPGELSGGECQRAAVARALINAPSLLLADEPTGSLDQKNASQLIDLLLDINHRMNVTLLVATHSKSIAQRMNRIYTIQEGKLVNWKE